jgi:hypothetical protein
MHRDASSFLRQLPQRFYGFDTPVFSTLVEGNALVFHYEINRNSYSKPYYLANGIYPNWAALVKTFGDPHREKNKEVSQTTKDTQERCGTGIWCTPSSVGYISSPC